MDKLLVGNTIARLRKEKGMTQKQLAVLLHVSDKAVSKWERGINYPDIELIEKLTKVLGISVEELLGIVDRTPGSVLKEISVISKEEKDQIKRQMIYRSILNIAILAVLFAAEIAAAWQFHMRGTDGGIPGMLTGGMLGFIGLAVGNTLWAIGKIRRL